jgi:hypothetical protein
MWRKENARSQTRRRRHTRKKSTLRALSCNGREVFYGARILVHTLRYVKGPDLGDSRLPHVVRAPASFALALAVSYIHLISKAPPRPRATPVRSYAQGHNTKLSRYLAPKSKRQLLLAAARSTPFAVCCCSVCPTPLLAPRCATLPFTTLHCSSLYTCAILSLPRYPHHCLQTQAPTAPRRCSLYAVCGLLLFGLLYAAARSTLRHAALHCSSLYTCAILSLP